MIGPSGCEDGQRIAVTKCTARYAAPRACTISRTGPARPPAPLPSSSINTGKGQQLSGQTASKQLAQRYGPVSWAHPQSSWRRGQVEETRWKAPTRQRALCPPEYMGLRPHG